MSRNGKMRLGNYRKNQKINKTLFIYLFIGITLLLGFVYQKYSIYHNASRYGRVGELVNANGTGIHLYTSGSSEMPLVFASNIGASAPYVEAAPLIQKLPSETAAVVYDRPGYGWSEVTNAPRDINTIVSEIHTVLKASHYDSPIIFVAHSMGSLEALRYAQLYPEEVAGVVLIDGASPEFCSEFNNIMISESFIMNALRNTGILRLLSHTQGIEKVLNPNTSLPQELQALNKDISLEKLWNKNMIEEKMKLKANSKTILKAGSIGNVPLRIITSKTNPYGNWQDSQKAMLKLSTDSSQTFIEGSASFLEEKDFPAILAVINELKLSLMPEEE